MKIKLIISKEDYLNSLSVVREYERQQLLIKKFLLKKKGDTVTYVDGNSTLLTIGKKYKLTSAPWYNNCMGIGNRDKFLLSIKNNVGKTVTKNALFFDL